MPLNCNLISLRILHLTITLMISLAWLIFSNAAIAQELISLQRKDGKTSSSMHYKPATSRCKGIAIVSHGAGGSERGYGYIGKALASMGYATIVVGHEESGLAALKAHASGKSVRDGLASLITDAVAYQARFLEIESARIWARQGCDSKVEILIGHSMGAATVMLQAGARNKLNLSETSTFTAYIAISPQGSGLIFPKNAWSDINHPVLLITGTLDDEIGGLNWESRVEPFTNMKSGCKWLSVINGSNHMNFAGRGISQKTETLTMQVIGDFLHAFNSGDCSKHQPIAGMTLTVK